MEKLTLYIKESYYELINKVTWPTWAELQSSTTLVLIASLIFAAAVFVMDVISRQITSFIYN
ncbi:MAG: preprotein translocase subunit SecE [Polaribacter sp.]|jgi:preprotein translocase subunit SecE